MAICINPQITIFGKRLYLRELSPLNINLNYLKWMNNMEVTKYTESRHTQITKKDIEQYVSDISKRDDSFLFGIYLIKDDCYIGNIKLGPINQIHRTASVGIIIGETECWGKGFAAEAVSLLTGYAFKKLELHKVTAGCIDSNIASIKMFLKAGFINECTRLKQNFFNNAYHDVVMLCKFNQDA